MVLLYFYSIFVYRDLENNFLQDGKRQTKKKERCLIFEVYLTKQVLNINHYVFAMKDAVSAASDMPRDKSRATRKFIFNWCVNIDRALSALI